MAGRQTDRHINNGAQTLVRLYGMTPEQARRISAETFARLIDPHVDVFNRVESGAEWDMVQRTELIREAEAGNGYTPRPEYLVPGEIFRYQEKERIVKDFYNNVDVAIELEHMRDPRIWKPVSSLRQVNIVPVPGVGETQEEANNNRDMIMQAMLRQMEANFVQVPVVVNEPARPVKVRRQNMTRVGAAYKGVTHYAESLLRVPDAPNTNEWCDVYVPPDSFCYFKCVEKYETMRVGFVTLDQLKGIEIDRFGISSVAESLQNLRNRVYEAFPDFAPVTCVLSKGPKGEVWYKKLACKATVKLGKTLKKDAGAKLTQSDNYDPLKDLEVSEASDTRKAEMKRIGVDKFASFIIGLFPVDGAKSRTFHAILIRCEVLKCLKWEFLCALPKAKSLELVNAWVPIKPKFKACKSRVVIIYDIETYICDMPLTTNKQYYKRVLIPYSLSWCFLILNRRGDGMLDDVRMSADPEEDELLRSDVYNITVGDNTCIEDDLAMYDQFYVDVAAKYPEFMSQVDDFKFSEAKYDKEGVLKSKVNFLCYAHNGSRFDSLYVKGSRSCRVTSQVGIDSNLKSISVEFPHVKSLEWMSLTFRDTLPFSLDSLGSLCKNWLPRELRKKPFDIVDKTKQWYIENDITRETKLVDGVFTAQPDDGVRAFRTKPDGEKKADWREYLEYDIVSLAGVFYKLETCYSKLGLSMTSACGIPGLAWQQLSRNSFALQQGLVHYPNHASGKEFIRDSVAGGRVVCLISAMRANDDDPLSKLMSLDANSLYPSAMTKLYPVGIEVVLPPESLVDIETLRATYPFFIAEIDFLVPEIDNYGNERPVRFIHHKTEDGRMVYPGAGIYRGTYSSIDIEEMLIEGYQVTKVYSGFGWVEAAYIYKDMIENMYTVRLEYKAAGNQMEVCIKLILNGAYGKNLETIKEGVSFYIPPSDKETGEPTFRKPGDFMIGSGQAQRTDRYDSPQIVKPTHEGAFILSYTKQIMNAYFRKIGINNVYYSDTDSIYCTIKAFQDSGIKETKALGGVKNDYGKGVYINEALFIDTKKYMLKKEHNITGASFDAKKLSVKGVHQVMNDPDFVGSVKKVQKRVEFVDGTFGWRDVQGREIRAENGDFSYETMTVRCLGVGSEKKITPAITDSNFGEGFTVGSVYPAIKKFYTTLHDNIELEKRSQDLTGVINNSSCQATRQAAVVEKLRISKFFADNTTRLKSALWKRDKTKLVIIDREIAVKGNPYTKFDLKSEAVLANGVKQRRYCSIAMEPGTYDKELKMSKPFSEFRPAAKAILYDCYKTINNKLMSALPLAQCGVLAEYLPHDIDWTEGWSVKEYLENDTDFVPDCSFNLYKQPGQEAILLHTQYVERVCKDQFIIDLLKLLPVTYNDKTGGECRKRTIAASAIIPKESRDSYKYVSFTKTVNKNDGPVYKEVVRVNYLMTRFGYTSVVKHVDYAYMYPMPFLPRSMDSKFITAKAEVTWQLVSFVKGIRHEAVSETDFEHSRLNGREPVVDYASKPYDVNKNTNYIMACVNKREKEARKLRSELEMVVPVYEHVKSGTPFIRDRLWPVPIYDTVDEDTVIVRDRATDEYITEKSFEAHKLDKQYADKLCITNVLPGVCREQTARESLVQWANNDMDKAVKTSQGVIIPRADEVPDERTLDELLADIGTDF